MFFKHCECGVFLLALTRSKPSLFIGYWPTILNYNVKQGLHFVLAFSIKMYLPVVVSEFL